jgi:uncharacterized membrane protein
LAADYLTVKTENMLKRNKINQMLTRLAFLAIVLMGLWFIFMEQNMLYEGLAFVIGGLLLNVVVEVLVRNQTRPNRRRRY